MTSPLFVVRAGQRVAGYTLEEELGEGTYGQVWQAKAGGVDVALKFIRLGKKEGYREWNGVRRVRNIQHPNLMPITGIWMLDQDGNVLDDELIEHYDDGQSTLNRTVRSPTGVRPAILVVAMQMADMNLQQKAFEYIEDSEDPNDEGRIPVEELLPYVEQAAKAIDFLNTPQHDLGEGLTAIQHLDIKPENLMLRGETVLICDFGLAQTIGDTNLTMTSQLGTLAYISPECLEQRPSHHSDQYSLACSYYKLRTGDWPFGAKSSRRQVEDAHLHGKLNLTLLPDGERQVIARATKRNPEARYESALEMVEALQVAVHGKEETPPQRGVLWPLQLAASFLLMVAIAVGVMYLVKPEWFSVFIRGPVTQIDYLWEAGKYAEAFALVEKLEEPERSKQLLNGVAIWRRELAENNRNAVLKSLPLMNQIVTSAEALNLDTEYEEGISEWLERESKELSLKEQLSLVSELANKLCCQAAKDVATERGAVLLALKKAGDEALENGELATAQENYEIVFRATSDSGGEIRTRTLLSLALTHARQDDWSALQARLSDVEGEIQSAPHSEQVLFGGLRALVISHDGDEDNLLKVVLDELVKVVQMPSFVKPFEEHPRLVMQLLSLSDKVLTKGIQLQQSSGLSEEQKKQLNLLSGDLLDLHARRLNAQVLLQQENYAEARQQVNDVINVLFQKLPELNDFAKEAGERLHNTLKALLLQINLADPDELASDTIEKVDPSFLELVAETNVPADLILDDVIARMHREMLGGLSPTLTTGYVQNLISQMPSPAVLASERSRYYVAELMKLDLVREMLSDGFNPSKFSQNLAAFEKQLKEEIQDNENATLLPKDNPVDALLVLGRWECELAKRERASKPEIEAEREANKVALDLMRVQDERSEFPFFGYGVYLDALALSKARQDSVTVANAVVKTFHTAESQELAAILRSASRQQELAEILLKATKDSFDEDVFDESPFEDDKSAGQVFSWLTLHERLMPNPKAQEYKVFAAYYGKRLDDAIDISDELLRDGRNESNLMLLNLLLLNAKGHKQRFESNPQQWPDDAAKAVRRFAQLIKRLGAARTGLTDTEYYERVLVPALELNNRLLGEDAAGDDIDVTDFPFLLADIDANATDEKNAAFDKLANQELRNDVAAVYAAFAEFAATDPDIRLPNRLAKAQALFKLAAALAGDDSEYKIREAEVLIDRSDGDLFDRIEHVQSVAKPFLKDDENHPSANALMGWVALKKGYFEPDTLSQRVLLNESVDRFKKSFLSVGARYEVNLVHCSNANLLLGLTYRYNLKTLRDHLDAARQQAEEASNKASGTADILAKMMLGNILEDYSDPKFGNQPIYWGDAQNAHEQALEAAEFVREYDGVAAFNLGRFLYKRATIQLRKSEQKEYETALVDSLKWLQVATKPEKEMFSSNRAEAYYFWGLVYLEQARDEEMASDRDSLLAKYDDAVEKSVELFDESHRLWAYYQNRSIQAASEAFEENQNDEWLVKVKARGQDLVATIGRRVAARDNDFYPQDVLNGVKNVCSARLDMATKQQLIDEAILVLKQTQKIKGDDRRVLHSLIDLYLQQVSVHREEGGSDNVWLNYDKQRFRTDIDAAISWADQLIKTEQEYAKAKIFGEEGTCYFYKARLSSFRQPTEEPGAMYLQAAAALEKAVQHSPKNVQAPKWQILGAAALTSLPTPDRKRVQELLIGVEAKQLDRYDENAKQGLKTLLKGAQSFLDNSPSE